jgi:hypothetical protein
VVLTAIDSTYIGNRADGTVKNCTFSEGGAIFNAPSGAVATVIRCTFIGNQAVAGNGSVTTNGDTIVG